MTDLKTQMRDYLEDVVARVDIEDVEELVDDPTRPRTVDAPSSEIEVGAPRDDDGLADYFLRADEGTPDAVTTTTRKRATGVVTAIAAAILLLVGIVVVVNQTVGDGVTTDSDSPPSVADPVAPPSVDDPIAPPSVFDPISSYRWSRIPHDEATVGEGFEQVMSSVTVGGPGLVAVGQAGGAKAEGAVWTSVDGISWSRVPGHEEVFAEAPIDSVTAGGPGLVAVGVAFNEGEAGDGAAVWTSVDGFIWSRVPHDEAVFGGAAMTDVVVGGPGLVAVGWDGHPHGEESNGVVWTSVDGLTWSRVPHDEAIFGSVTGAWMESITAGGPGLVAVGHTTDYTAANPQPNAAVWTSPDGFTWSRVPHDEAVFGDSWMEGVAAGGPGLIAVGSDATGAAVWTSPDGFTWSRVPHDEAVFGDSGMGSVVPGGPGMVASGISDDGVAVWTSVDGLIWSRVAHDEAVFGPHPKPILEMRDIVAGGPGLVGVGANQVPDTFGATDSDAAVWVATLEE